MRNKALLPTAAPPTARDFSLRIRQLGTHLKHHRLESTSHLFNLRPILSIVYESAPSLADTRHVMHTDHMFDIITTTTDLDSVLVGAGVKNLRKVAPEFTHFKERDLNASAFRHHGSSTVIGTTNGTQPARKHMVHFGARWLVRRTKAAAQVQQTQTPTTVGSGGTRGRRLSVRRLSRRRGRKECVKYCYRSGNKNYTRTLQRC